MNQRTGQGQFWPPVILLIDRTLARAILIGYPENSPEEKQRMRFGWHGGHSAASESIAHKTDFRLLPVLLASFAALWLATHAASATDFYVSPSGSASGDGSVGKPWSLAAALAQPAAVRPGDTIWLRGGTYTGGVGSSYSFSCSLNGSPGAPITVAQYPG